MALFAGGFRLGPGEEDSHRLANHGRHGALLLGPDFLKRVVLVLGDGYS
jgi:hypothetical protein